jgi:hypothetical protein
MELNKNMGAFERGLRMAATVVFGYLYFSGTVTGTFAFVLLVLGVIFLVTSFVSFCPLYLPFEISTCKK